MQFFFVKLKTGTTFELKMYEREQIVGFEVFILIVFFLGFFTTIL